MVHKIYRNSSRLFLCLFLLSGFMILLSTNNKAALKKNIISVLMMSERNNQDWQRTPKLEKDSLMANPQSKYSWHQSDSTIALVLKSKIIWQYNFAENGKPYFHPLNSIDGNTLTWLSPPDHPWHMGLWFSWKFINGLNYWEEDPATGISEGLTKVIESKITFREDFSVKINMKISYHPPEKPSVLSENRELIIFPPDDNGDYYIDWKSKFTAGEKEVILERTPIEGEEGGRSWGGYATLSLRMNSPVLKDLRLLNNEGKENLDIHTTPTKWVDISGVIKGDTSKSAGITIFDYPSNPRFPAPGYVINNKLSDSELFFVYTNSGLLYKKGITLKPYESLNLKYRVFIHSGIGKLVDLNKKFDLFIK